MPDPRSLDSGRPANAPTRSKAALGCGTVVCLLFRYFPGLPRSHLSRSCCMPRGGAAKSKPGRYARLCSSHTVTDFWVQLPPLSANADVGLTPARGTAVHERAGRPWFTAKESVANQRRASYADRGCHGFHPTGSVHQSVKWPRTSSIRHDMAASGPSGGIELKSRCGLIG